MTSDVTKQILAALGQGFDFMETNELPAAKHEIVNRRLADDRP